MLNVHLSYKRISSWRILFWSGGYPRQFSCLEKFRALVVPGGDCHKGVILQGIMTPRGVLPNGHSCLRRKGGVTGESDHAPIHSNSTYIQMVRRYIYKTRQPEHPHLPIRPIQTTPPGILFGPVTGCSARISNGNPDQFRWRRLTALENSSP